jgi:formate hydrogenlyase transcriptional activator
VSEKAELEKDKARRLWEGPDDAARSGRYGIFKQQALSTAQLQSALNAIPAYTWYATPSGVLTFVNERKADYLGLPTDHPLRLGIDTGAAWDSFTPLLHPDDRDEMRRVWSECLRTGAAGEADIRLRNAQGGYRWFTGRAEPIHANDGTLLYWIGVSFDIEEREQLTRALRKSQEVLQQILDLTPHIVAVVGPGRERLYANKTALDYIGRTLEEWRKESPGTVHPDDFERLQSRWDGASSDGSAFELEVRIRRRDGIYRWHLARYNPVYEDEGKILRWYSACTDIEDRKRDEEKLQRENIALREQINQASMFEEIVGTSAPLQKVLTQVSKVAPSDSTVLVLGETGTGKELIARAIHERSGRAARAFIGMNCAAIPASLIASELFGHEKGAFTGAAQRRLGRFEAADGGTIFLDEVGDLPMDMQIALLRVLQEHEIERIGRDKPIPVDVRVIAATHRDLKKLVSEGKFRQDLFYRLNVVPITMPALRERAADIPLLVEYFIARFGRKTGKRFRTIEKKTLEALKTYDWPGNVRELQNVIERAVTLSDSDIFAVDEAWLKREPSETSLSSTALGDELLAHEKEVIEATLAQSQGRVAGPMGAAARLGLPTSTLDSKIKRLGIDKYRFKAKPG